MTGYVPLFIYMVVSGTLADTSGSKNEVMTIYNKDNPLTVGDTVKSVRITGGIFRLILFISLAAALAVYRPARRIRSMPITESINEL